MQLQISDSHLRAIVAVIVADYRRQAFLASTVNELTACYEQAFNMLMGIQLVMPESDTLLFVQSLIERIVKTNAQCLDRLTQQMALQVEQEAFLLNTGDLGRSPAVQSPVAVGQGGTHEH